LKQSPDTLNPALLSHGPVQPPPVIPHRGTQPKLPHWMRRFAIRSHLSCVRLGLEILRDDLAPQLVCWAIRWLGIYLWTWIPLWLSWHLRYRLSDWWP
jgi:hypothetical protein